MQKIPYGEVVEVEQELISEGLPEEEVIKLCDIHSKALEGNIDHTEAKSAPPGHPVHTFLMENEALLKVIEKTEMSGCAILLPALMSLNRSWKTLKAARKIVHLSGST